VEDLGFAAPYSGYTRRLEGFVACLCEHLPEAQVAELSGLVWKTVKEIDKRALDREFAAPDYSALRLKLLAINDLAYKKGYDPEKLHTPVM